MFRQTLIALAFVACTCVASTSVSAQAGGSIDLARAERKQSDTWTYLLPHGWRCVDRPDACVVASPDLSIGVGYFVPGFVSGRVTSDQYMRHALRAYGKIDAVRIHQALPKKAMRGWTDSCTFLIEYRVDGIEYMGILNVYTAQEPDQTYGFVEWIQATPEQMDKQGDALVKILQSIKSNIRAGQESTAAR